MRYFLLLLFFSFIIDGKPNFVLIGPPGSGKGTFSSFMIDSHQYRQICPGDILRNHIKQNTELGQQIKPIVERGDYIDDSIIFQIIEEEITDCITTDTSFIIDGFPRSTYTFEFLDKLFQNKNIKKSILFVHFEVDDSTCIERINNRIVCFNCFSIFNVLTKKPQKTMICDNCKTSLESRLGDTIENTKKRLAYYRKNIEPLTELAKSSYSVLKINADQKLADCLQIYKNLEFCNR